MSGPGQPTDPGAAPPPPPDEQPPATAPPPPSASTPPPAAPPPPTAGGAEWGGKEEKPPEWVQQAQNWRPADVAAGPAPGVAYADLTTRIIAYIIDAVILGIAATVLFTIVASVGFVSGGFGGLLIAGVIIILISVFGGAIYFIYSWTTMRASPGQKILNLQTVSEKDGSALTQNQAIIRYLYMFAPGFIAGLASRYIEGLLGLILSLAGLAWTIYLLYTTANDPKRQGYHDKQAGSVVVKVTPASS